MNEPHDSVALAAAATDLDFWLGTWRGTWTRDSAPGEAINVISREFGGHVIVENFRAQPPDTLRGLSLSVFDHAEGCWKQTWVDDTGSYLDFRGGPAGGELHLSRELISDGEELLQRMIFCNIEPDRFDWLWQRSRGNGTWETVWEIAYVRVSDAG